MKRIVCLLLVVALTLGFSGCAASRKDAVTFYYRSLDFAFGTESGAIGSEIRDISGQKRSLTYLTTLYMLGPADEKLALPFPANTKVSSVVTEEKVITITLSLGGSMSDSSFTLGCTCLALNCFALTDAENVCVVTEKKSLTIARDSVVLTDADME